MIVVAGIQFLNARQGLVFPVLELFSRDDVLAGKRLMLLFGYDAVTHELIMSKWVLILGGLYSFLLLYIYVILPALK